MSRGQPQGTRVNDQGTILAVDDDTRALELLAVVLGEEGYRVQPADSGRLALISFAAQTPDLILLDLRMPDVDGLELCRRVKQTEEGRRTPVIFLSASNDVDEWVEALATGAVDFISKPFRREELVARVRAHVELSRLQSTLEVRVAQRTAELRNAIEQLQLEAAERRKATAALRESEQRFRQIANAAPVIIWTSCADNRVDFRSEYAHAFTGRTLEQLAGDGWDSVIHADDLERHHSTYAQSMAARVKFQLECRILRADGEHRWMLDRGIPRFLPDGEFAGYAGILVDITDMKHAQEQALAARNLENLRVLSAGIAHDFNTLIGSIFGETDLALSDMAPDAPGRDSVERIGGIAKRAADIVHLLSLYAGDPYDGAERELTDLSAVVREIVPHLKTCVLQGTEFHTTLDPRLPSVWAKSREIRQVVLNIIINAVEALGGKKGSVAVTTASVDLAEGRFVKLEVSDTGNGMTETVQARMFDPYYSTKFLGRGLGLAAVQGIIRLHSGRISARSSPGGGSTFEVLLPVAH
jgi:PAS domain S-box-containing protein